jgi:hypothetical protein
VVGASRSRPDHRIRSLPHSVELAGGRFTPTIQPVPKTNTTCVTMNVYRARPVKKKQTEDYSCWAACLESWTHTTKLANLTENALLKYYGQPGNGGLNLANLTKLRTWLDTTRAIKSAEIGASNLDQEWMENHLKKSYVLVVYQTDVGSSDWHALLIYGKDNFLYYMQPKTGEHEHKPFYNITSPDGFYLFWTE